MKLSHFYKENLNINIQILIINTKNDTNLLIVLTFVIQHKLQQ
jgi:hypothetical protein